MLAILLSGCATPEIIRETPQPDPLPTPTPVPVQAIVTPVRTPDPASPTLSIERIALATTISEDGAPVDEVSAFPEQPDQMHLCVQVRHVKQGDQFRAYWLEAGQVIGQSDKLALESSGEPVWIPLSYRPISRLHPTADHVVELRVNGATIDRYIFRVGTGNIEDVVAAAGFGARFNEAGNLVGLKKSFPVDSPQLRFLARISNQVDPTGMVFSTLWYRDDTQIARLSPDRTAVPGDPRKLSFTYTPPARLAPGKYRVVLLISGSEVRSATFSVAGALPDGLATADPDIQQYWSDADGPVASGKAERSWLWGPDTWLEIDEPYAEAPGGLRTAYYFDKARMEVNQPPDTDADTYITAGLLVRDMIKGAYQVGDAQFAPRAAANIPLAGDPLEFNPDAPTYASLRRVASVDQDARVQQRKHEPIIEVLTNDGRVFRDRSRAGLAYYGSYDETLGHNIAAVFDEYLTTLPIEPMMSVGLPLTEPYWVSTNLGGNPTWVLVQAFERRILTYTPTNPDGWQVEMGNIGRHYHTWRYGEESPTGEAPQDVAAPAEPDPEPEPTPTEPIAPTTPAAVTNVVVTRSVDPDTHAPAEEAVAWIEAGPDEMVPLWVAVSVEQVQQSDAVEIAVWNGDTWFASQPLPAAELEAGWLAAPFELVAPPVSSPAYVYTIAVLMNGQQMFYTTVEVGPIAP